ncbi:hypothetical protein ABPG72_018207 [Tetrahymena utriculariae]
MADQEKSAQDAQNAAPQETAFVGMNGEETGLGFATRDQGAKVEEDQGLLDFDILTNDGTHRNMKLLIDLKNIFSRQLPKMPKEYIVKLVFDRHHESMVILKNKSKVIGGICFRQYKPQRFAEVAFLAVTANEQVRGYGTRLMNKFKDHMQSQNIEYLLTYADNFAIGYFKKQGFTKEHRMPQEKWKGYIKDYDGGTLMECYIHPYVDYANISQIIKKQKELLIERIKKLSLNEKVFSGKEYAALIQNSMDNEDPENPKVTPSDIPGVAFSGWEWKDYHELKKSKERSFNLQCANVIENMKRHKQSWPFLDPVNKDDVPDYYDVITDPIDIKAIEKKLQNNQYVDKDQFIKDVKRIFTNAKIYNQPDTIYYKAAKELEDFIEPYLNKLKDAKESNTPSNNTSAPGSKKPLPVRKSIKKK